MKKLTLLWISVLAMALQSAYAQKEIQDSTFRRCYIGSTLFMLGNFIPDDPNAPDFIQLNMGYHLTPKDVISIELKTWKYAWPLGIPWGDLRVAPEEKYPGYIREFGIGFVYQRFWWKGIYTSVDAGNMLVKYVDENDIKIQNGYQLFMTYRLGYHIQLFKNRFFIEPSLAVTHWPVKTNVPELFANLESKWPNYFLFEPGLHFGVKF
jgi:hypothetical protein